MSTSLSCHFEVKTEVYLIKFISVSKGLFPALLLPLLSENLHSKHLHSRLPPIFEHNFQGYRLESSNAEVSRTFSDSFLKRKQRCHSMKCPSIASCGKGAFPPPPGLAHLGLHTQPNDDSSHILTPRISQISY